MFCFVFKHCCYSFIYREKYISSAIVNSIAHLNHCSTYMDIMIIVTVILLGIYLTLDTEGIVNEAAIIKAIATNIIDSNDVACWLMFLNILPIVTHC